MTAPHRTGGVNVARPLVYLGVAAAIGLGSLLLPSTGAAPPPPGALPAGSTMARIAARGRLIAGVDQGKYLVGYRNPITGQLEGSDIDIVRRIAAAIFGDPDRVQFVVLDIADLVGAIERGQVDL